MQHPRHIRFRRTVLRPAIAAALAGAACSGSTRPSVVQSWYSLLSVDGAPLPVSYAGQGFRGSQQIVHGTLALIQDQASSQIDSAQLTLSISQVSGGPTADQVSYYRVIHSGSVLILQPTSGSLVADTGTSPAAQMTIRTHLSPAAPVQSFVYMNITVGERATDRALRPLRLASAAVAGSTVPAALR